MKVLRFGFAAVLALFAVSAVAESNHLEAARQAIGEGRLDAAAAELTMVDAAQVDINDLDFLRGTLAFQRKDYDQAIDRFRAILARNPEIVRVRLDLARALYFAGDDAAALYHFHIAEAEELPPQVQANVNQFLADIRRRKDWDYSLSVGVAPDNNVNAATVVKTINIYGLPYQLDQNALKSSGIGFVGSTSGSYQFRLDNDFRLVMGGSGSDLDYEGNRFDDRSVGGFIGPRYVLGDDAEVTLKAVTTRRWYGGLPYTWSNGGRIETDVNLSNRVTVTGAIDVEQVRYDNLPLNTGPVASVSGSLTYGIDAASFVRTDLSVYRERTAEQAFRDTQYALGLTYYRDVAWGFGLLGSASIDIGRYDQALGAFGVARHDLMAMYRVGVSNKHLTLFGFMPVITVTHTNRYSDIGLYAFERDRAEISLTRNF